MSTRPKDHVLKAIATVVKAHAGLYKPLNISQRVMASALMSTLKHEEKETLGLYLYNDGRSYRDTGLLAWESMWFQKRLPQAPGKILVAACGAGREVAALLKFGFEVDAFDGSQSMVDECQKRCPEAHTFRMRFREYAETKAIDDRHYDAVLVGWGSVGHVYSPALLGKLARVFHRQCPDGPLLFSYPAPPKNAAPLGRGKAEQVGRAVGKNLCRVLGRTPTEHPYEGFTIAEGFLRSVPVSELNEIASVIGRAVIAEDFGYPTATLVKA